MNQLFKHKNKYCSTYGNLLGLPAQVTEGENRIRYTYAADGTLLRSEYGMYRMELYPNGGVTADGCAAAGGGAIANVSAATGGGVSTLAQSVFEVHGWHDRCGAFEYTDGRIERIQHEAGWIDSQGRHVAAIRDSRGSLRATLTSGSVKPTQSGGSGGGLGGGSLGGGLQIGGGIALPQTVGYDNLTAYYPYGLPFADWQGDGRDLFAGKELERASGLLTYDFHARQYDPQLGMFLSPDPMADSYTHLNPYLYCAANPVSYTDPTGCIIKSENASSLKNCRDDLIFAANLNKEIDNEYKEILGCDNNSLQLTFDETKYQTFMSKNRFSPDQTILLEYIRFAVTNENFISYVDYTPNDKEFPDQLQNALNTQFENMPHEYVLNGITYGGKFEPEQHKGSLREQWGGAYTLYMNDVAYCTMNPNANKKTRAMHTVHELLGHGVGFALGFNEDLNDAHALQMEGCYRRIHKLGKLEKGHHNIPRGLNIEERSLLLDYKINYQFFPYLY